MKKSILNSFLVIICSILLVACGKDNYDSPSSTLIGKVTYADNPVGVRGTNNSVRLQLWQDGYALRTPIDVYVTQDGSFTAALFDGTYKLITVPGNGPWKHATDTLEIQVNGDTNVEFPVEPYFTISDIQYNVQGNILTATFELVQHDQNRTPEEISLLVNDTQFVDLGNFTAKHSSTDESAGTVTISLDIADQLTSSKALFARVAVKASGITEAVYDIKTEKIK
ncbi:DUF3823 domain-containing protein [Sphingobacterium shayense]|uniref:DUF3823 domain-containing protein n=1 Tax=Sphingobacterium shayense TaxID=626343 RepID=UPI001555CBD2|nr:DUF3823 domain-containing protein [Sphingobacterium shayense]NQD71751.1 DUF3823 domain-containing protein [Sphingobacterium shayense]